MMTSNSSADLALGQTPVSYTKLKPQTTFIPCSSSSAYALVCICDSVSWINWDVLCKGPQTLASQFISLDQFVSKLVQFWRMCSAV